jgi:hypothetical protein
MAASLLFIIDIFILELMNYWAVFYSPKNEKTNKKSNLQVKI